VINWQPPSTAPKDASYFAVLTTSGDLEGWAFNRMSGEFEVRRVPGWALHLKLTTSSIKGWARWSEVIAHIAGRSE
jgi:hypothetical protein